MELRFRISYAASWNVSRITLVGFVRGGHHYDKMCVTPNLESFERYLECSIGPARADSWKVEQSEPRV